jgi:hypothetical protein
MISTNIREGGDNMIQDYGFRIEGEIVLDWEEQRFNMNMDALRAKCHLIPQKESAFKSRRNKLIGLAAKMRDTVDLFVPAGFRQFQPE